MPSAVKDATNRSPLDSPALTTEGHVAKSGSMRCLLVCYRPLANLGGGCAGTCQERRRSLPPCLPAWDQSCSGERQPASHTDRPCTALRRTAADRSISCGHDPPAIDSSCNPHATVVIVWRRPLRHGEYASNKGAAARACVMDQYLDQDRDGVADDTNVVHPR